MSIGNILIVLAGLAVAVFIFFALRKGERVKPDRNKTDNDSIIGSSGGETSGGHGDGGGH